MQSVLKCCKNAKNLKTMPGELAKMQKYFCWMSLPADSIQLLLQNLRKLYGSWEKREGPYLWQPTISLMR